MQDNKKILWIPVLVIEDGRQPRKSHDEGHVEKAATTAYVHGRCSYLLLHVNGLAADEERL